MLSQLLSFLLPLLYFLLATTTLVLLTKRSFGKCLPLAMMLPAFFLFFSQLIFGTFLIGFLLAIVFALSAIALAILKRKTLPHYKKLLLTPGLITFLIIYIGVFIFDLNRNFAVWDELTHWGMMVKEMSRLDQFYYVGSSNLMVHKDYPPIMQLFELFWTKLCGGFSEPAVERALHTFELSLITPFIAEHFTRGRHWLLKTTGFSLATIIATVLILFLFDGHGVIHTIYTDYSLALVVVYLLLTIYFAPKLSRFEIASLVVGGGFLLLLKQIGLPFYFMVLAFLALSFFSHRKITKYCPKSIIISCLVLIIPLLLLLLWRHLVADIPTQFDTTEISSFSLFGILKGGGELWQKTAFGNFINALAEQSISTSFIPVSFLQSFLWFIGFVWLLTHFKIAEKPLKNLALILLLGGLGYAFVMLTLYTSSFGPEEGPALASFDRYMGTYALILFLTPALIFINYASQKENHQRYLYAMLLIIGLISGPANFSHLYPMLSARETIYSKYATEAENLKAHASDSEPKTITLPPDSTATGAHFFIQYYATPYRVLIDGQTN